MQTTGAKVIYTNQKLLTEEQREALTHNVALYPSCGAPDEIPCQASVSRLSCD